MGLREAARRPAFAVEINAKMAAILIAMVPNPWRIGMLLAAREIGVSEVFNCDGGATPIVTKITNIYIIDIKPHERNIPNGISRAGVLHSSATLQTLVRPPKEMNTRPAVENIEENP